MYIVFRQSTCRYYKMNENDALLLLLLLLLFHLNWILLSYEETTF